MYQFTTNTVTGKIDAENKKKACVQEIKPEVSQKSNYKSAETVVFPVSGAVWVGGKNIAILFDFFIC